jgi:hypothetical protein
MFPQDGQSVGWDPRALWVPPTLAERLYAFYGLFFVVVIFVWVFEFLRTLGITSSTVRLRLRHALQLLRDNQVAELKSLAEKFHRAAPESGLRMWGQFSPDSDRARFLNVVADADEHFQFVASRVALRIGNLRKLFILSAILLVCFLFYTAANVFAGMSAKKTTGTAVIAWVCEEISRRIGASLLLLSGLYALYWHFGARLERRRLGWQRFCAQVRCIEK